MLDHQLRILIEYTISQIENNDTPNTIVSPKYLYNKEWGKNETLDDWYSNMEKIYNYSYEILYHKEFDGKYPPINKTQNKMKEIINSIQSTN